MHLVPERASAGAADGARRARGGVEAGADEPDSDVARVRPGNTYEETVQAAVEASVDDAEVRPYEPGERHYDDLLFGEGFGAVLHRFQVAKLLIERGADVSIDREEMRAALATTVSQWHPTIWAARSADNESWTSSQEIIGRASAALEESVYRSIVRAVGGRRHYY